MSRKTEKKWHVGTSTQTLYSELFTYMAALKFASTVTKMPPSKATQEDW